MHKYIYVHTANVIKGAGATIGAGNKNIYHCYKGRVWNNPWWIKKKSSLLTLQFVLVQRMKPWKTSHPSEVVITLMLEVNIWQFPVKEINRQQEPEKLCLVIMARPITTMHWLLISPNNPENKHFSLHQLLHSLLLQVGFVSISRQLELRSEKAIFGTWRRCWPLIVVISSQLPV